MIDKRKYWKDLWNDKANSESIFEQAGRRGWNFKDFFVALKDINSELNFDKQDVVLDAGGGTGMF